VTSSVRRVEAYRIIGSAIVTGHWIDNNNSKNDGGDDHDNNGRGNSSAHIKVAELD